MQLPRCPGLSGFGSHSLRWLSLPLTSTHNQAWTESLMRLVGLWRSPSHTSKPLTSIIFTSCLPFAITTLGICSFFPHVLFGHSEFLIFSPSPTDSSVSFHFSSSAAKPLKSLPFIIASAYAARGTDLEGAEVRSQYLLPSS